MKRLSLQLLVFGFAVVGLASASQAAVIPFVQNTTTNTSLLADSFENQTTGTAPSTANMDPSGFGSWTPGTSGGGTVLTSTTQAFASTKSVEIFRPDGGAELNGTFTSQVAGTLDVRMMVYITDPVASGLPNIVLASDILGNGSTVTMTPILGETNTIRLIAGVGYDGTPLYSTALYNALQTNTWQEWRLIHTIGTDTLTAMIGNVSETFSSGGTPTVSFGALNLIGNAGGSQTFFVDAVPVPEPNSAILLLVGGVGLLAAKRMRRK